MRRTRAATTELDPIDADDEGQSDYSGELVSDVDFGTFSHSALVRIADEVCLQMHLLNLSFIIAVGKRAGTDTELANKICTNQLTGIAGVAAERIHRALGLPGGIEGAVRTLELHPLFNPTAYVTAEFGPDSVSARRSPAHEDGAWISLVGPSSTRPLQAAVAAVDPHLGVEVTGTDTEWTARVVENDTAAEELVEVVRRACQRRLVVGVRPAQVASAHGGLTPRPARQVSAPPLSRPSGGGTRAVPRRSAAAVPGSMTNDWMIRSRCSASSSRSLSV